MGVGFLAGGLYLRHVSDFLSEAILDFNGCLVATVIDVFSEIGNGANFSLVPHCNSYNNVSSISDSNSTPNKFDRAQ